MGQANTIKKLPPPQASSAPWGNVVILCSSLLKWKELPQEAAGAWTLEDVN